MILVSVTVPVHVVESYIQGILNSVLGQTLNDFELLIDDDK